MASSDPPSPPARLRAARLRAGLSRAEVAARMGVFHRSVGNAENGSARGLEWVYAFAAAVGCRPSELDARLTDNVPT
jgi:transcriptional regulator with XRE-family HTH domain